MIRSIVIFGFVVFAGSVLAQSPGTAALPNDEAGRCRYGAEHMIEFAKQSLTDSTSRPQVLEKRRQLIDEWASRLEDGDDPCAVYMDIQKAATTF